MNSPISPLEEPISPLEGSVLLIDNSALEFMQTCPRSAQYSIVRRLRPNVDKAALHFGGIIHKVLETRYRLGNLPGYPQDSLCQMKMLETAEKEFSQWSPPEEDFRNLSCATSVILEYGKTYPEEDFQIATFADGTPCIEVPFALPLGKVGETTIVWQGRIDLVYTMPFGPGLYVMDHKTASIATNMDEFVISHQFYGYAWAVEQLLGRSVLGTVINRIVVRRPTRTGTAVTLERRFNQSSHFLIDEWKNDILHICADLLENARRDYFPKHTAWCAGKFGTCPFLKVCSLDSMDQRELVLNSGEFVTNDWSPLK